MQPKHPIHMTDSDKSIYDLQQGMNALQALFSGAKTITIKGEDGRTPQVGVDYLTREEIEKLKLQIGQLVIDHVLPRIYQPRDGRTPIAGVDFPTPEQIMQFAEAAIERIKKQKLNREQLASDVVNMLKGKKGIVKWDNVGDLPDMEKIVAEKVEEISDKIRKEVIKKEAIDWRHIRNKPDFDNLLGQISGGGGPILRIQEEGVTVSEHVMSLNFIGGGATASYSGNGVIAITIPGGTGNFAENETPAGTQNGTNDTFTLTNSPSPVGSLQLYMNGQLLTAGGEDYTLSGGIITYVAARIPVSSDVIRAWYRY